MNEVNLLPSISEGIALLAAALISVLVVVLRAAPSMVMDWLKIKNEKLRKEAEALTRAAVESALKSGAALVIEAAKKKAIALGLDKVQIENQLILIGARYVNDAVPAKLQELGITEDEVKTKVEAWVARALNLPEPGAGTTTTVVVSTPSVAADPAAGSPDATITTRTTT